MELARRQSLLERMKGAALLDVPTCEEVEARAILTALLGFTPCIVAMAGISAPFNLPGRAL